MSKVTYDMKMEDGTKNYYPLAVVGKDGKPLLIIQSKPVEEIKFRGKTITREKLVEILESYETPKKVKKKQ